MRPTVLCGHWGRLAEDYGGVTGLARALGVHPSTVWNWGTGRRKVPQSARIAIARLCADRGYPAPTFGLPK